jgi:septum formation protein
VRPTFVLASASAARLATLRAAGLDPQPVVSGVDESTVVGDDVATVCATLARLKAQAVATMVSPVRAPTLVLGCDSLLEFDGAALGKPADAERARQRWHELRGRQGILHTGHCLLALAPDSDRRAAEATSASTVSFADVSSDEIDAYVQTGEPLGVAGAFTIDGLGGWFVDRIEGDSGTVIGVSLPTLRRLLRELGVSVPSLWAAATASP